MMHRELFARVLLAVADCWPVPGRLQFEISPCGTAGGCRLVITDQSKNYSDTISVSCNFEPGSDACSMVRSMYEKLTSSETTRVKPVRIPRTPRAGAVAQIEAHP